MGEIRIMSWSCDAISNKIFELSTFVKLHNIHIILLTSQLRLNSKSNLRKSNFFIYRTKRPSKTGVLSYGGTAILVHHKITHNQELISTKMDSTTIQAKLGNQIVQISSVYKKLNDELIPQDINALTNHNGSFVVAGDLNAKNSIWYSNHINRAGKVLAYHMETSNAYTIIASESPARYSYVFTVQPDVLNIALINLPHIDYILAITAIYPRTTTRKLSILV